MSTYFSVAESPLRSIDDLEDLLRTDAHAEALSTRMQHLPAPDYPCTRQDELAVLGRRWHPSQLLSQPSCSSSSAFSYPPTMPAAFPPSFEDILQRLDPPHTRRC